MLSPRGSEVPLSGLFLFLFFMYLVQGLPMQLNSGDPPVSASLQLGLQACMGHRDLSGLNVCLASTRTLVWSPALHAVPALCSEILNQINKKIFF